MPEPPHHGRAGRPAASACHRLFFFLLAPAALIMLLPSAAAQQPYEANAQTDCYTNNGSSVLGYTCRRRGSGGGGGNATQACDAYLAFRSAPAAGYSSPISVSYLLNATAPAVAAANGVPVASPVEASGLLLVPVPCACTAAGYYQHGASYVIQSGDETYFTIANNTYQGLATCQALMAQNPAHDSLDLYPNISLSVPLRCACPSPAQAAAGVRYLVTYVLGWDDDSSTVAGRFRADYQAVLDANSLTDDSTVYPFTTMLVPLNGPPPTHKQHNMAPAPAPAPTPAASDQQPAPAATTPTSRRSSSISWRVMFGAGVGCGVLVSGAVLALLLLWRWRRRRGHDRSRNQLFPPNNNVVLSSSEKYGVAKAVDGADVRDAVASLTVYEYGELERATAGFAEERRIGGSSVYRAVIDGEEAAVKRVAGGVLGAEVAVLGRVNHSCLVRLRGLCVHRGDTHLVFEFALNGALSDRLHGGGRALRWEQRVQVAFDVADGLNYLHNYTSPPYVHKDLKSSNVLLDAALRAKVSNFGLARAVVGAQMTRHVVGTEGYMAPEYLEHGLIGPHLDVFAFGVVLLELLSGKEAAPPPPPARGGAPLLLWQEAERLLVDGDDGGAREMFMDARLRGDYPMDAALALLGLALRCVAREPRARPSMGEVLLALSAVYGCTLQHDTSSYGSTDGA
ncbi:unnamed protein product [Urochloa decumbens]|uniref:Protein kinase domain-containing protein n=1 Tax=Urochloa decumbens TaxID=240449 RepID=A0ABC8YG88_9POAL